MENIVQEVQRLFIEHQQFAPLKKDIITAATRGKYYVSYTANDFREKFTFNMAELVAFCKITGLKPWSYITNSKLTRIDIIWYEMDASMHSLHDEYKQEGERR